MELRFLLIKMKELSGRVFEPGMFRQESKSVFLGPSFEKSFLNI